MSLDSILRSVGKNLLNSDNISVGQFCTVVSKGNGGAVITSPNNKENTATIALLLRSVKLPAGTYTFSCNFTVENTKNTTRPNEIMIFVDGTFKQIWNLAKSDGTYAPTITFTIDKESEISISWYFNTGAYTASDTTAKVTFSNLQLEKDSTATTYEPYQQGPKSIKIGDKEVLKISYGSRNLWQNTNTTFPTALSYNSSTQTYTMGTGTTGFNFIAHKFTNPIPAGTTVTISIMFQSGKGRGVAIGGYHRTGGKSWQGYIDVPFGIDMTGQTRTSTFTTTETVEEFMVFHNNGDNIEEPFIFKVQYEIGDKATEYVPYSREVVWKKQEIVATSKLGSFKLGESVLA